MFNNVTLITPTGMRPESLKRCVSYVSRFELKEFDKVQWIVVDDGPVDSLDCVREAPLQGISTCLIRPGHRWSPGQNTLAQNLLAAIPEVKHDKVFFIEDDDWYSRQYLSNLAPQLDDANIVGEIPARYYHLPSQKFWVLSNSGHASLCQTGIRKSFLSNLSPICKTPGGSFIDVRLWRSVSDLLKAFSTSALCIGLKGLPGREGIGIGHRPSNPIDWTVDSDLTVLSSWVGSDIELYSRYLTYYSRSKAFVAV